MLFLLNSSGVPSVAASLQLGQAPPDFSVSAIPPSQDVVQGDSTTYTVSVTPASGFTGDVSLNLSGLPQDATASFNPGSITTSGSSTLTVNTLGSTPVGSYPLTITATSGSLVHTTMVTLGVSAPPDFSLSVLPAARKVNRGGFTIYKATVTASGGFSGTVSFSVGGLPTRTRAKFNPTSLLGSGTTTLRIDVGPNASTGTNTLTITGSSGGLSHSSTVSLQVQ
jgi:hypothetical protein